MNAIKLDQNRDRGVSEPKGGVNVPAAPERQKGRQAVSILLLPLE